MTIRMPDEKHERFKSLARQRGVSVNQLMVELATLALAEFDNFTKRPGLVKGEGDSEQLLFDHELVLVHGRGGDEALGQA